MEDTKGKSKLNNKFKIPNGIFDWVKTVEEIYFSNVKNLQKTSIATPIISNNWHKHIIEINNARTSRFFSKQSFEGLLYSLNIEVFDITKYMIEFFQAEKKDINSEDDRKQIEIRVNTLLIWYKNLVDDYTFLTKSLYRCYPGYNPDIHKDPLVNMIADKASLERFLSNNGINFSSYLIITSKYNIINTSFNEVFTYALKIFSNGNKQNKDMNSYIMYTILCNKIKAEIEALKCHYVSIIERISYLVSLAFPNIPTVNLKNQSVPKANVNNNISQNNYLSWLPNPFNPSKTVTEDNRDDLNKIKSNEKKEIKETKI